MLVESRCRLLRKRGTRDVAVLPWRPSRRLVVSAIALGLGACRTEVPEPTNIRNAFARHVALEASGDYETDFFLLVQEARDRITRTHENVRRCREIIESRYPPDLRAQALANLGPPEVREAPTPQRFYAALMRGSNRPTLTVTDRLKAKIRRIEESKYGTTVVTTVSGERSEWLQAGDGRFYRVPNEQETALIQREFLRSVEVLETTQAAARTFDRSR